MITERAARDAFAKWQRVLRVRDVSIDLEFLSENIDGGDMETEPVSDMNRHEFFIRIAPSAMRLSPFDFWTLAFHEVHHVLAWGYVDIVRVFADCDAALVATAEKLEERLSESIAYKLQQVLPKLVRMPASLRACE